MYISVHYEPHNDMVALLPDNLCENYVKRAIDMAKFRGFICITVGQGLIIEYLRLYVCRGIIKPEEIEFIFDNLKGQVFTMKTDKNGRLDNWPKGFCDHTEDILNEKWNYWINM